MSITSRRWLTILILLLAIAGIIFLVRYRSQPADHITVSYSQSGEVVSVQLPRLTIGYLTPGGTASSSSDYSYKTVLIGESTELIRRVKVGEENTFSTITASDILVGMPVVIYLSQISDTDGPPLVAQKVELVE